MRFYVPELPSARVCPIYAHTDSSAIAHVHLLTHTHSIGRRRLRRRNGNDITSPLAAGAFGQSRGTACALKGGGWRPDALIYVHAPRIDNELCSPSPSPAIVSSLTRSTLLSLRVSLSATLCPFLYPSLSLHSISIYMYWQRIYMYVLSVSLGGRPRPLPKIAEAKSR